VDLFLYISFPIGTFLSAYIYKYTGFYGTFGTAAAMHVCSLLYVVFFIHESEVRLYFLDNWTYEKNESSIFDEFLWPFENIFINFLYF